MNSLIDYNARALAIRQVLSLCVPDSRFAPYMLAAKLRILARIEQSLADRLRAGGVGAEAAAQSAFTFVRQVADHHRGTLRA
ncbi:hypothetical protein [Rhizobacter fulvus]